MTLQMYTLLEKKFTIHDLLESSLIIDSRYEVSV